MVKFSALFPGIPVSRFPGIPGKNGFPIPGNELSTFPGIRESLLKLNFLHSEAESCILLMSIAQEGFNTCRKVIGDQKIAVHA